MGGARCASGPIIASVDSLEDDCPVAIAEPRLIWPMKKALALTILLLLPAWSVMAQDGQSPDSKLHRDFPGIELMRPSIPPWRYNFDRHRWERDKNSDQAVLDVEYLRPDTIITKRPLLPKLGSNAGLTSRRRHRKSPRRAVPW